MGNLPTLTTPFPVDAFLPVSEVLFPNTSQKRIITATAKTAFKMSDKFFIRIFFLLIIISDFLLYPKFVFFFAFVPISNTDWYVFLLFVYCSKVGLKSTPEMLCKVHFQKIRVQR